MNKGLLLLISALPLLSKCDFLGAKKCDHVDNDPKDHVCDLCNEKLSEHTDVDPKDHICDYCGEKLSEHSDTNPKDHICDYCAISLSEHSDTNPFDHVCDYCGATIGAHSFGEWTVVTPATNKTTGLEHRVCACGEEETRIIPVLAWNETQKNVFAEHLYGYELPCSNNGQVIWEEDIQSVVVIGDTVDAVGLFAYANEIVADGFVKTNGQYTNTYTLLKEVNYQNKVRTIEIDLFATSEGYISTTGEGQITAVCYDPYLYEWPQDVVDTLFNDYFYIAPTAEVPSASADKYLLDTTYVSSSAVLAIYCSSQTNNESIYKLALEAKGFTVSESKDEDGYYVANEPGEIVQVLFQYLTESKALCVVIQQYPGWPAQAVDYYLNQLVSQESSTTIPAVTGANKYEFIDSSWDQHGYFFVLCECDETLEPAYETALTSAGYTLYNTARNSNNAYAAISEDNDLLVQYSYLVSESIMGGEDYKQFDVMFEPYYPHNEEHIEIMLNTLVDGTETTIPAYPGLGEKITPSDNNKYVYITIQSATFASIKEYVQILKAAGWIIKTQNELYGQYLAVSPNRDITISTNILDGRVQLTLAVFDPKLINWPILGIDEIMESLNLTGEVPEFDGAYGFDYENTEVYHDIVCLVSEGDEEDLIKAYYEKLESEDWHKLIDGDYVYYVKADYTVGLHAYTEYAGQGKVFIDIFYADETVYDIEARGAFVDWKFSIESKSSVLFPGINLTEEVKGAILCGDSGETYPGYELFEILVDIENTSKTATIDEIVSAFTSDGWVYSSSDEFYHKDDAIFKCYEDKGYIAIDVALPMAQDEKPILDIMKEFIIDLGYSDFVTLPESINISAAYSSEIDTYDADWVDLSVYLTFATSSDAVTAKGEIKAAFEGAGWTESGSTSILTKLIDDSGMLYLELSIQNNVLLVQFADANSWW